MLYRLVEVYEEGVYNYQIHQAIKDEKDAWKLVGRFSSSETARRELRQIRASNAPGRLLEFYID